MRAPVSTTEHIALQRFNGKIFSLNQLERARARTCVVCLCVCVRTDSFVLCGFGLLDSLHMYRRMFVWVINCIDTNRYTAHNYHFRTKKFVSAAREHFVAYFGLMPRYAMPIHV